MNNYDLKRRMVSIPNKPDYPDRGEIITDRRRFLRLFGGLLLGTAAGLATAASGVSAAPRFTPDDPPVPGDKVPFPEHEFEIAGGLAVEPEVPVDLPQEGEGKEGDGKKDPPNTEPEIIRMPGEAPAIEEQPEFELDGDVAAPSELPEQE